MRTNVVIDDKLMSRAMRTSGCRTKRSAIESGLRLLVNPADQSGNEHLHLNSVRRLSVLSRVAFPCSVMALEGRFEEIELEAIRLSDAVVLVIRADVPTLRRTKWALDKVESLGVPKDRFQLVVNRWGQRALLGKRDIEETLGMTVAEFVPDDPARVNHSANRGELLASRSPIGRKLTAFAQHLDEVVAVKGS